MKKIICVAHCLLNNGAKLQSAGISIKEEDALRKEFLSLCIDNDIQILQLPCPEFTLYGARRWGHCMDQFNNPFFKEHCKNILNPTINQLKEYMEEDKFYEVLGIIGVDGSPSCGVDYTCKSNKWFGEFSDRSTDLLDDLGSIKLKDGHGVFIQVLSEELKNANIPIKITGLFEPERDKVFKVIEEHIK